MTAISNIRVIFIVGSSRSGTTMMARILGANDAVATFHELHFFEELWEPTSPGQHLRSEEASFLAAKLLTNKRDGYYRQKDPRHYQAEAADVIRLLPVPIKPPMVLSAVLRYEMAQEGKKVACVQTPRNVYYIPEILDYYPCARIIHMVRDPRDVLLSQKKKWQRGNLGASGIPRRQLLRFWANYHPATISMLWNGVIRAVSPFRDHPRFYNLRFEDLLAAPEREVRALCDFLALQFQPGMLAVPQIGSSHRVDKRKTGIDAAAAGRWQERQAEEQTDLAICEWFTQEYLVQYGYEPCNCRPTLFGLAWSALSWPLKTVLAFLLNIRRVQNVAASLRKRFALGR